MIIDVDRPTALHLGIALRAYIRELDRVSGLPPPPAVADLAARLSPAALCDIERDSRERIRAQWRERQARSRARRRAERESVPGAEVA